MATPPPKVPLLRLQPFQGAGKGSPLQRVSDSNDHAMESAVGPSVEMTPAQQPVTSRPTSSHSSMSAEDAGMAFAHLPLTAGVYYNGNVD